MSNLPAGDRFSHAPISKLIGFDIIPGEPGEAIVFLDVDERLHNPMGRVHGGVLALLADAAMGIAFGRTLDPGQDFATVDLHIHFMRPIRDARLKATAKICQRGLRIGFVECEIMDQRGKLLAKASCSCTVLTKEVS